MSRKLLTISALFFLMFQSGIASARPVTSLVDSPPPLEFSEIITGLSSPVALTNAGDGSGRLFITLLGGQIMIFDGSNVLSTPFLDISSLIVSGSEQGLLSVAFHPNYTSNGYFYVYYTRAADGALVIARYHVSGDANVADSSSQLILLTIPHSDAANHNGGQLQFGPDGYLYIGTGDGGTGGANSQDGSSLLGKMLRIDVNSGSPYSIPADNPFVLDGSVRDEVWALGLRNPWRFSFDRSTGDLIIADVGQNSWEEVNFQSSASTGGQNYGWPCFEGTHSYDNISCTHGTITPPVIEYSHGTSDSNGCAITGGYRYRGSSYPGLYGVYLFGDLCTGRIWGGAPDLSVWTSVELSDTNYNITAFGEDESGGLYVTDYYNGSIYKLLSPIFIDVPYTYWANDHIERLYKAHITGGCLTTPLSYCPDSSVTRAQMAIFLLKSIHGSSYTPPAVGLSTGFSDVDTNYWDAAWIKQLAAEGITNGCGGGNFCPDAAVNRAQMAVFLLKAEHTSSYTPSSAIGVFNDVPIDHWAANWIEQLSIEGVTSGCSGSSYCPDTNVTRAQMAVFLVKAFGLP